ncbi:glycoside hydrolase family 32 protein [Paenibacillus bovis]|uniref:Glycoside hydrolase n=1 Tax=Paenibacillus bovis TaxID=1616788 RepID=A0A172ZE00_9BACL|nr:glycoside hydrolase family 32 protein [Paenibacillus bovis]ANF95876.1 glycoside hydrolase [Paenibacillus bovis]
MSLQLKPDYRGAYHFSPSRCWMNDPNGMVYLDGEYHLFFQHHPHGDTWGPMHWGHAITRDLVHWEELPIALEPDEHGTIFSGSAVVDWHNTTGFFPEKPGLVAIFTHHDEQPDRPVRQSQSLAYSHDRGRTWHKYAGNPVLTCEDRPDFRDPKVFWHELSSRWIMVLACGQRIALYHSPDLKNWSESSVFGQGIGCHDGVWECPDLFELPIEGAPELSRWVMLVSIGDNGQGAEGSRPQYFTGHFDGEVFLPDEASQQIRWLDHGRDNYAGVSWSDIPQQDGRRLYIGWMSNWRYANQTPTGSWRGAMTIVRELMLEMTPTGVQLLQRPVHELASIRQPVLRLDHAPLDQVRQAIQQLQLESYEWIIRTGKEVSFEIQVRAGAAGCTRIGVDADSAQLYIDRTQSGQSAFHKDFANRHTALLQTIQGERELRILVDTASVEVFADQGRTVMTDLIFPEPGANRVMLTAAQEDAGLYHIELYDLSGSVS